MTAEQAPPALLAYEERTALRQQLSTLGLESSEILEQIRRANESDTDASEWRNRAHGALRAKERQIRQIKLRLGADIDARRAMREDRREAGRHRPRYAVTGDALGSIKLLVRVFQAASSFIDDDSDENYDHLSDLVAQGRNFGLMPEEDDPV